MNREVHPLSGIDRTTTGASVRHSRRAALRSGGLAAIAASLLGGTVPEPTVAAEPIKIPTMLPTVVSTEDLVADCTRLLAELKEENTAYWAAEEALRATLTPEQNKLYTIVSDAASDTDCTYGEWVAAEMARHVPGFSTVIRLLWVHATGEYATAMSQCCTPAEGYEP